MRSFADDERIFPLLFHAQNRKKTAFSYINLDWSYVRTPLLNLVLFIYVIPTLMIAINQLFNSESNHLTDQDELNLKVSISGLVFTLTGIICSYLKQWYHVTNHLFCVRMIVSILFFTGGSLLCIATALTTNTFCNHTKDTIFKANYNSTYCHFGFIATQVFAALVPIVLAFDVLCNLIGNVRMRLLTFNLIVVLSSSSWVILYIHYLDAPISPSKSNMIMTEPHMSGIYNAAKIGWLLVSVISALSTLFMLPGFYHILVWSNKVKTTICSTFAVLLLTGMALSLVSIDILLFEFKFEAVIYGGIISIITFDLLTF